ncbi:alpha/beta hydrolase family protein [Chromobacterium alticapitis]|uniref:Dienelactone hydrolase domain-containing protein n=1 Tax=Chromobacterium alticapitis TaxID=2073169 RepID=A0A2S5DEA9_9NEIS|nr:dienelactone hydrolase family protein [Chromobacterium alticapitis]POZ61307.1 hypothetical protein C2I19_14225 [Chromobacterium alticapitis]
MNPSRLTALAALLACSAAAVHAADKLAADLGEKVIQLPVTLPDGSRQAMTLTLYRPNQPGPHPLALISHGRAPSQEERAKTPRQRAETAARYFVRKGFVVLVPTRIGYGDSAARLDPENIGSCQRPSYRAALAPQINEIQSALDYGRKLPDVDPRRIVLMGVSVGGMGVVAAAAHNPPGVVTAINFSGGHGGNPQSRGGAPCDPEQLRRAYAEFGQHARMPMLWLYARNDNFFGPAYSQAWAKAYRDAGGKLDFRLLPPFGDDGHKLYGEGTDIWMPQVDAYLAKLGFTQPGTVRRPPPSGYANLQDKARVPYINQGTRQNGYGAFLRGPLPRAFSVSLNGRWGYAYGPDAMNRALDFCRRGNDQPCALYAVDRDVVWRP